MNRNFMEPFTRISPKKNSESSKFIRNTVNRDHNKQKIIDNFAGLERLAFHLSQLETILDKIKDIAWLNDREEHVRISGNSLNIPTSNLHSTRREPQLQSISVIKEIIHQLDSIYSIIDDYGHFLSDKMSSLNGNTLLHYIVECKEMVIPPYTRTVNTYSVATNDFLLYSRHLQDLRLFDTPSYEYDSEEEYVDNSDDDSSVESSDEMEKYDKAYKLKKSNMQSIAAGGITSIGKYLSKTGLNVTINIPAIIYILDIINNGSFSLTENLDEPNNAARIRWQKYKKDCIYKLLTRQPNSQSIYKNDAATYSVASSIRALTSSDLYTTITVDGEIMTVREYNLRKNIDLYAINDEGKSPLELLNHNIKNIIRENINSVPIDLHISLVLCKKLLYLLYPYDYELDALPYIEGDPTLSGADVMVGGSTKQYRKNRKTYKRRYYTKSKKRTVCKRVQQQRRRLMKSRK